MESWPLEVKKVQKAARLEAAEETRLGIPALESCSLDLTRVQLCSVVCVCVFPSFPFILHSHLHRTSPLDYHKEAGEIPSVRFRG